MMVAYWRSGDKWQLPGLSCVFPWRNVREQAFLIRKGKSDMRHRLVTRKMSVELQNNLSLFGFDVHELRNGER